MPQLRSTLARPLAVGAAVVLSAGLVAVAFGVLAVWGQLPGGQQSRGWAPTSRARTRQVSLRRTTNAGYAVAVRRVCTGALLFTGTHELGTRAGATDVARDIRATGAQRLHQVERIPVPADEARLAFRWLAVEHHLVEMYATDYVRVWNAIDQAYARHERAQLPSRLDRILHAPDALQRRATALEQALGLPDCTGNAANTSQPGSTPGAA